MLYTRNNPNKDKDPKEQGIICKPRCLFPYIKRGLNAKVLACIPGVINLSIFPALNDTVQFGAAEGKVKLANYNTSKN